MIQILLRKTHNENPKIFTWTKDAETILSKVNKCKEVLQTGHQCNQVVSTEFLICQLSVKDLFPVFCRLSESIAQSLVFAPYKSVEWLWIERVESIKETGKVYLPTLSK